MSGYVWAKTAAGELLVVLLAGERGYVPGVENAIDMGEIVILEPVAWPKTIPQSPSSAAQKSGRHAQDAMPACVILPFVVNG